MPAPNFLQAEVFEVLRRLLRRGSSCARTKSMQALGDHLGRQAVQVALERIARQHAVREDARLALDRDHLTGQQLGDELLHVGIAQVQPVAGLVEVEAARLVGARVAAEARLLLEEEPRPLEVEGGRDPGQTTAEDDHPRVRVRVLHRRTLSIARTAPVAQSRPVGAEPPGLTAFAQRILRSWLTRGLARSLR